MSARIITEAELNAEASRHTVRCTGCRQWIRYSLEDRVTDKVNDRRFVICPGCDHERVLTIGGIKDGVTNK